MIFKHLRRALKYFIQITLIFGVIIGIMMVSGMASTDINTAFRSGWKSVQLILAAFALMSLIYPFFGYGKRAIHATGDPAGHWKTIDEALDTRGYVFAGETPEGGVGTAPGRNGRSDRWLRLSGGCSWLQLRQP